MIKYSASKLDVILAPVWVPGFNDDDIPNLIEFGKEAGVKQIAIQNFLNYRFGRNPAKQKPFEQFFNELQNLEKEHGVKLIVDKSNFNIVDTKKLPIPFSKDEILKLKLLYPGKQKTERLAADRERVISVITDKEIGQTVKAKVIRTKHNIIIAKEI